MDNMKDSPPPVDNSALDGVTGIHLGYLRRDVDEIKSILKDTNTKIDNVGSSFVSHTEFSEHLKVSGDHETRLRSVEDSRMKVVVLTGSITGFLSIIGSYLLSLLK